MPKERPTQLLAAFNQNFGDHFQPTKFAFQTPSNVGSSISSKESNGSNMEGCSDLDLETLDLTPTAESMQMTWAQEGAPLTVEPDSKPQQIPLCVYFRLYREEGYYGDDDIFRAVYLPERTAEKFVRGVCKKSSIDETAERTTSGN
ncbi:hypothetical protein N7448_011100 [Penicillium atrosanguineum]|uniref:Uncharacterized protein n=1 Tax=Penicillium atrosanguineum TaxID=1132637 RepID=A0A9W9GEJ2_9EURO|nr:hypothetical protein N7448_011100 [Penicillium atrosanguineum]KAJ5318612.1 hypothetical protein N7476_005032 [Penicillium atrosanguineum]